LEILRVGSDKGIKLWFPKSAPRATYGPRISVQINNLYSADHQIILSGPRIGKFWEPLG